METFQTINYFDRLCKNEGKNSSPPNCSFASLALDTILQAVYFFAGPATTFNSQIVLACTRVRTRRDQIFRIAPLRSLSMPFGTFYSDGPSIYTFFQFGISFGIARLIILRLIKSLKLYQTLALFPSVSLPLSPPLFFFRGIAVRASFAIASIPERVERRERIRPSNSGSGAIITRCRSE